MSKGTAITLIFLHASISATFAIIAGKPLRQWNNIAFLIIMSANNYIAIPLSTLATLAAFACQANCSSSTGRNTTTSEETPRTIFPDALSLRSTALQTALFFALALSWPSRLQLPRRNPRSGEWWWWVVTEWYPQVGWACVNNGVIAVGSVLVLYIGSSDAESLSGGGEGLPEERDALLSS
jgi:hypothetical protein